MAPPTMTKTHTTTIKPIRKPSWLGCCFGHRSSSNRVFERPPISPAADEGGSGTDRDEISYKKVDESLDGGGCEGVGSCRRRSKIKRYWRSCWPVVRNRPIMKKSASSSSSCSPLSSSSKAKHERSSSNNKNKLPWKWLRKGNNDKGGVVEVTTKANLKQASSQSDNHRHVPFAQVVVVERTTTSRIDHKSSQTTRQWVNFTEGPQLHQPNASNETTTSTCHKVSTAVKKPPKCKTLNQNTDRPNEKPGSTQPNPPCSKPAAGKKPRAGRLRGFERDCIMGASILLVTLMVMICCGRLCAILCTSVWLYCGPWLIKANRNVEREGGDGDGSGLSSEQYRRKKVVLEGLLDRTRKRSIDISLMS